MTNQDVNQMQQKIRDILGELSECLEKWVDDLLKDALRPEGLLSWLKSIGVNPTDVTGMMSGQPALNPYTILGLDKSAEDDEVKQRFRELLRKLHPDTAGLEGTGFLLQMVLAAYEMIRQERGWQRGL